MTCNIFNYGGNNGKYCYYHHCECINLPIDDNQAAIKSLCICPSMVNVTHGLCGSGCKYYTRADNRRILEYQLNQECL
jgi:hypothetical protein